MRDTDIQGIMSRLRRVRVCNESFLLLAALMLFTAALIFPYRQSVITSSDTVVRADTFFDTVYSVTVLPIPYYVETVRHDTVLTEHGDTVVLPIESKAYRDTLAAEGDTAIVRSWVSGYKASLDSLKAEFRSRHIVETVTITERIKENKRLGIYVGPTLGYDPVQGRFNTSISIGIGYRIWR